MGKYKGLLDDIKERQAGGAPAAEAAPPSPALPPGLLKRRRHRRTGASLAVPRAAKAATRSSSRPRLTSRKRCISRSRKPCLT